MSYREFVKLQDIALVMHLPHSCMQMIYRGFE